MGLEFGLEIDAAGDAVVIAASGELDLQHRDTLAEAAIGHLEQGRSVVVDLAKVTFIDSSGLSALIRSRQAAHRVGGSFSIRGASGAVARVLEITGLGDSLSDPDQ